MLEVVSDVEVMSIPELRSSGYTRISLVVSLGHAVSRFVFQRELLEIFFQVPVPIAHVRAPAPRIAHAEALHELDVRRLDGFLLTLPLTRTAGYYLFPSNIIS